MKRNFPKPKLLVAALLFFAAMYQVSAQLVVRRSIAVVHRPVPMLRPYARSVVYPVVVAPAPLPRYYVPVFYAGNPYFYSNGVFYVKVENSEGYKVVLPPVGTLVPSLPNESRETVIDGKTYYEYEGVIYKRIFIEEMVKYEVVGYTK
ncbi:DUF6515 family protein [Flagellimonas baculiformis]|uniref:DUF6515 family protein n=1 Tax=Flagellimonas baculiformis TaxID=3067310 RepID=UPI00296F7E0E|nr:DUF6515 family protein [Muricauda sp. D6]